MRIGRREIDGFQVYCAVSVTLAVVFVSTGMLSARIPQLMGCALDIEPASIHDVLNKGPTRSLICDERKIPLHAKTKLPLTPDGVLQQDVRQSCKFDLIVPVLPLLPSQVDLNSIDCRPSIPDFLG